MGHDRKLRRRFSEHEWSLHLSDCRHGARNIMVGLADHRSFGSRSFVQATSKSLVECHEIFKALEPHDLQLLLRIVKRSLSIKLAEVVVDTAPKANLCQVVRVLRGAYQCLLRRQLLVEVAASRERISHLAERNLDCFFVLRHRGVTSDLGRPKVGFVGASCEERNTDLRCKRPRERLVLEQTGKLGTSTTQTARQFDGGKKRSARRTDIGVGCSQEVFGSQYIRPVDKNVGRNSLLHSRNDVWSVESPGKVGAVRNGSAEQQLQRIAVLG